MSWIVLLAGECDGHRQPAVFDDRNGRPDVFYAVPLADLDDIKKISDPMAREAAYKSYGKLAYVFSHCMASKDGLLYHYRRADPRRGDPADKDGATPGTAAPL